MRTSSRSKPFPFLIVLGLLTFGLPEPIQAQRSYLRVIRVADLETALQLREQFVKGVPFQELARQHSSHPTATRGGFLGEVLHSQMNALFLEAVGSTPEGSISQPFLLDGQYMLLQPLAGHFRDEAYQYEQEALRLQESGHPREALEPFQKALDVFPDFVHIYFLMGVSYRDLGEVDREIASYREALRIEPDYQLVHYNLGLALLKRGRPQESIASLRRAAEIKPDYVNAWISLSGAYLGLGDLNQAVACARKAVEMNPLRAGGYYNLGAALSRSDLGQALESFHTAVALNPHRPDYQMALAVTTGQLGRTAEAIELLKRIVQEHPDFEPAKKMLEQLGIGK